jgi:hypothetical protein
MMWWGGAIFFSKNFLCMSKGYLILTTGIISNRNTKGKGEKLWETKSMLMH